MPNPYHVPSTVALGLELVIGISKEEAAVSLAVSDELGKDAFSQANWARSLAVLNAHETAGVARSNAVTYNFISCIIIAAQNGFGENVVPLLALSRETRGEEVLWDAVKDIPSPKFQRTRLMYAAKIGDAGRLRWLVARGAKLELEDSARNTALWWACNAGQDAAACVLLLNGSKCALPEHYKRWLFLCSSLRELAAP